MTRRDDPALYRAAERLLDALLGDALMRRFPYRRSSARALRLIREAIEREAGRIAAERMARVYEAHTVELDHLRAKLREAGR